MRAQSWILIIIALGCGLVASIGISQVMDRGSGENAAEVEMENIFVALVDISVGDPITSQMIKLDKWPKDKIPEGAITKLDEIEKRRPRSRIFKGEPILIGKLIGTGEGEGPQPTPGYRALAIKVTSEDIGGGMIKPGDRVDIMVYLEKGNRTEIAQTMIRTFLRDVKVFAVDSSYERDPEQEGKPLLAKTITLEVKPKDVEKIMLAQQLGKIRLTLRGTNEPSDQEDSDDTTRTTSVEDITGESSRSSAESREPASPTPTPTPDQQLAAHDLIHDLASTGSNAKPEPTVQIRIIEPTGIRKWEWRAGSDEPIELTGVTGGSVGAINAGPALPQPLPSTFEPEPTPGVSDLLGPEPPADDFRPND